MSKPWQKREQIGDCTLYLGDCLEILPVIGNVDAVVTDPPYGIRLNTDNRRFSGGIVKSNRPYNSGPGSGAGRPVFGDDKPFDPAPFLALTEECLFWGFNCFPDKLSTGSCLVWIKKRDGLFGTFLSDAEIAWYSKGHGVYCRRDISAKALQQRVHPTQKPVGIMEWCLQRVKGQIILDPFMGSGTTGVACIQMGRKFIGIEIEEAYFDIACRRIEEAYRQGDMFRDTPRPQKLAQETFDV